MIQIIFLLLVCAPLWGIPLIVTFRSNRRMKYLSILLGTGGFVTYFISLSVLAVEISLGDSRSLSENLWNHLCYWYEEHVLLLEVITMIATTIVTVALLLLILDLGKLILLLANKQSIKKIDIRLVMIVFFGLIVETPVWWLYGLGVYTRALKAWLFHG